METILRKSRHLQVIKRTGGTHIIYHKMFGNLSVLNDTAMILFDLFDDPVGGETLKGLFQQYGALLNGFYDMFYITEQGSDERAEVERDLEERSRNLTDGNLIGGIQFNISDACNFACSYCFCDIVDARGEKRKELAGRGQKLMPFETAVKAIDTLLENAKRHGKPGLVVKFYGREPLLNWKVIEKVLIHYGFGEKHGIQIAYAITTNGSMITPEIAETLGRFKVATVVSIDGPSDINNHLRKTKKTGSADSDVILRGIEYLRRAGGVHSLSAVVTQENFRYLDTSLVDFVEECGVKSIQILPGIQGDFLGEIEVEDLVDKLYDIFTYGRSRGTSVSGYWLAPVIGTLTTRRLRSSGKMERDAPDNCGATGFQVAVEPSGDIFPCRSMASHLGHIDDFEGMLKTDAYRNIAMRTYNNVEACHGCSIEGFCQGPCPGSMEERSNDIYDVNPFFCKVYKKIHDKVLYNYIVPQPYY